MIYQFIREKIINSQLIERVLFFFLLLQPVLDIYILFRDDVVDFFGFSPSTIIRIGFVGVLGLMFLFIIKNKKEV